MGKLNLGDLNLDLGDLPPSVELLSQIRSEKSVEAAAGPCCKSCAAPLEKYFSVDVPHGFCGECCMDPKKFSIYKLFEKNLTKASDGTPCSEQFTPKGGHYTKYTKTVT